MKEIQAVIDTDGSIHIKTQGYKGKACLEDVKKLLRRIEQEGVKSETGKIEYTPEYFSKEAERAPVRQ